MQVYRCIKCISVVFCSIYPQGAQIVRCNKNMHSVCLWNDFDTMERDKYDDYTNYPYLEKTYGNNLNSGGCSSMDIGNASKRPH